MNFFPDPAAFSDLALRPSRVFSAVCTDVRRCGPERGLLHRTPWWRPFSAAFARG
jgi:hypothetical protein